MCVCSLQTVGGDNDYVKVPTPRRRPTTIFTLPNSEPLVPVPPAPATPDTEVSPPPELPAPPPVPGMPVVYETLRQDATGGNVVVQPEYLLPNLQYPAAAAAEPVDLTELLANQQMNAAAVSSAAPAVGNSAPSSSSQQQSGVVKRACRQPSDEYYDDAVCTNVAPLRPSTQSPRQFSLYTNMSGCSRAESVPATSTSVFTATSPAVTNGSDASTAAATSEYVLRRPSTSASSSTNAAGHSPCGSAVAKPGTFRLPSYEESMSSDTASLGLSPLASPLSPAAEATTEASPSSASALPGYDSPPSYVSEQLLELNANTPLKSRQVQQLLDEMSNDAGVRVQLDKTQCAQALALIDCFDRVW